MTKPEEIEDNLIETVDEEGNVINFELIDIVEVEGQEYALLLPQDGQDEEDKEVVLMKLSKEDEEYVFEMIEDDNEFNKVVEFLDSLEELEEEEEQENVTFTCASVF